MFIVTEISHSAVKTSVSVCTGRIMIRHHCGLLGQTLIRTDASPRAERDEYSAMAELCPEPTMKRALKTKEYCSRIFITVACVTKVCDI